MCGIFGYIDITSRDDDGLDPDFLQKQLQVLFRLSETRGKEAAGLAMLSDQRIGIHKDSVSASYMIKSNSYKAFWKRFFDAAKPGAPISILGHTRLVTNGLQVVDANNQPVVCGSTIMIHNGIIVNDVEIWKNHPHLERKAEVDTEAFAALLDDKLSKSDDIIEALGCGFDEIYGETSIAVLFADRNIMVLASNTGSLYTCFSPDKKRFFFVSEDYIARRARDDASGLEGFKGGEIQQVPAGTALIINLDDMSTTRGHVSSKKTINLSSFEAELSSAYIAPRLGFMREIEEKHQRISDICTAMKRCTSCVMPETMPFIEFDEKGVCNYCRSYEKQELKGRDALEEELSKMRHAGSMSADCLVAFSGGRDSSYGLHLLVTELGMKPATYTYDWGMVTDLARRNQARMCDKLGLEHIWVSADIRQKRANIRRNVLAWLKRPNLGMIPLFMAGDKQFYHYAYETAKQTGITNLIFCANILERTDFKSGFAGIRPDYLGEKGEIRNKQFYNLGSGALSKLLGYYGSNFAMNPAYLNRSLPDTMFAYVSYYMRKVPYTNIFEYLPWNEEEGDRALIDGYDWETAPDAESTWRIGDGTAPFYNYIYYEVAGFSEFDTLRSNQIREGHITRDMALKMLEDDNQPRFEAIREYCQTINVEFEECLRRINAIPKMYLTD
jgi:glutamine---fructose-6-phosphate transaminase (isomerizing)